jgi:hypothetical protein
MNDRIAVLVLFVVFAYGLFLVIWPEKARSQFLQQYDLDARAELSKPATWMRFRPTALAFRIMGVMICAGIALLFLWWL